LEILIPILDLQFYTVVFHTAVFIPVSEFIRNKHEDWTHSRDLQIEGKVI